MKKIKPNLLFLLSILFYGLALYGNNTIDDYPDSPDDILLPNYAQLRHIQLTQTVDGNATATLNYFDQTLLFSSQLVFENNPVNWSNPTFEQSFLDIFVVSEENVTVTNENGAVITSVDIVVEHNYVTVSFQRVDNSFDYLIGSTVIINIEASLREDIIIWEAFSLNYSGFRAQSKFYVETATQHKYILSNFAIVSAHLNPYLLFDIVGDPRNHKYAYKLDIVLFVPADVQETPDWRVRISELLLKHQQFTMKWMEHWGYGPKSFGLSLDKYGLVDIVVVRGALSQALYPHTVAAANAMLTEIRNHYARYDLPRNNPYHIFVIKAIDRSLGPFSHPFFGLGNYAFAIDLPFLSRSILNINPITNQPTNNTEPLGTSLIGGLFHEMFHGLGLPHAGNRRSEYESPLYGTSLMGHGNRSYGRTPTFLTHSCAATLNVSRVSTFESRPFRNPTQASVTLSNVIIDGGYITVKGSFTASESVTDVIIRFLRYPQTHAGGAFGYTSIPFVTRPQGNHFEMTIPIWELSHRDYEWRVKATILMKNGTRSDALHPAIYQLVCTGTYFTLQTDYRIERSDWQIIYSPNTQDDPEWEVNNIITDNDLAWHSRWTPTPLPPLPHRIDIDMQYIHSVASIEIMHRADVADINFYLSQDGAVWMSVGSLRIATNAHVSNYPGISRILRLATPMDARYVRLEVTESARNTEASIWNIFVNSPPKR